MKKTDKGILIEELKQKFADNQYFYVTDSSTLTVEEVNKLRGLCYEKGVEMRVVKNTLAKKALESIEGSNFDDLYGALKGPTTIFFTDTANVPAKLIKEYRGDKEKPALKAAYIDSDVFTGDDQLEVLASLKSKNELIADVVFLLQSPIKNVVSSLNSGGQTIAGLVKALEEKAS